MTNCQPAHGFGHTAGLNHGHAKSQLEPEVKRNQPRVSADTLNFADLFCKLQDERHSADYNPRLQRRFLNLPGNRFRKADLDRSP